MISQSSKRVSLTRPCHFLAAVGALLLTTALPAIGQSPYHLIDLGSLGGPSTFPTAINNRGQVLGQGLTGVISPVVGPIFHAYLYDWGVLHDIAPLPGDLLAFPVALNDEGQALITSEAASGNQTGFVSDSRGIHVIAPLPGGFSTSGNTINAEGQVIGHADPPAGTGFDRGMFWDAAHGTRDIGTLNPDPSHPGQFLGNSQANGLNDSGVVVGWAETNMPDPIFGPPFMIRHAVRWTQNRGLRDLGTLSPDPNNPGKFLGYSTATAINPDGWVIGTSDTNIPDGFGNVFSHGFVWTKEKGMQDLGTLDPDPAHPGQCLGTSTPMAINARGQIVGVSDTAALNIFGFPVQHAFLWTPGGRDGITGNPQMKDLGVAPGDIFGQFNSQATGINDFGDIIGASDGPAGNQQGFLYTGGVLHVITFGNGAGSQVNALNEFGVVVGQADTPDGFSTDAFFYDRRGIHDLGNLGSGPSAAVGINDFGLITGQSHLSDFTTLRSFIVFPFL